MEFDESGNVGSSRRTYVEDCTGARLFPCTGNKLGNKITPRPSATTLHVALVQYGRVVSPRIVSAVREKSFEGHGASLRARSLRLEKDVHRCSRSHRARSLGRKKNPSSRLVTLLSLRRSVII